MPTLSDRSSNPIFAWKSFLATFLFLIVLSGCGTLSGMNQKKKFSELSKAYKTAILWSDFEYASEFLADGLVDKDRLDPIYENVKVTAFEKKRNIVDADVNKIEEVVEIRYYWIDRMVEKSITDHQVWEWNAEARNWYLVTGLPSFE